MIEDAARASTIKAIVRAAFGAAGQRCMALSVMILVGDLEESRCWVKELKEEAEKLRVGSGFVDGVDVGQYFSMPPQTLSERACFVDTILTLQFHYITLHRSID